MSLGAADCEFSERLLQSSADGQTSNGGSLGQPWVSTVKSDALTGKSYTMYELAGRYLTPPSRPTEGKPRITLRCDPLARHGRISGKLLAGFVYVGTTIDLENGHQSTVKYRLDDGKVQTASEFEVGYSTDYQAISITDIFLDNLLWGHMLTHKPHTNPQVRKAIISVQEHLAGNVVMEFDMPDAEEVSASCGTEYKQ